MNSKIKTSKKRAYNSKVRQAKMQATRHRILEGLVQAMADGVADLSIPAVSRASGVSIPTIYRYFANKRELVDALPNYLAEKLGAGSIQPPNNPDELAAMIAQIYARGDQFDDTLRAAAVSEAATNLRQDTQPQRLAMMDTVVDSVAEGLTEETRIRLRNALVVLASSAVVRAYKDYLGLSWTDAADQAAWTIRTLAKLATLPKD